MKHLWPLLPFIFLNFTQEGLAEPKAKDSILLQADHWCPYNCSPLSESPGYLVDIVRTALQPLGVKVEYKTLAWSEAIDQARKGKAAGIIGASLADAPEFVFPKQTLGLARNCFFTLPKHSWNFHGVKSLDAIKLGLIKGYSYGEELDTYLKEKLGQDTDSANPSPQDEQSLQAVAADNGLLFNLKKLNRGTIDALVEEQNVLRNTLYLNNQDFRTVRNAGCVKTDKIYIAFSPKEPKAAQWAEALDKTVEAMRKDGRLQRLLRNYGLEDWQP